MSMKTVKRLASRLLGAGISRIRVTDAAQVREALTTEDVRALIAKKVVYALPKQGVGRGKAQDKASRKSGGRRRGPGSSKGTDSAKLSDKTRWILQVRSQRKYLTGFKGQLASPVYRKIYRMIKGSAFHTRKQLSLYVTKALAGEEQVAKKV